MNLTTSVPICFSPKPDEGAITYSKSSEFYFSDGSLVVRIDAKTFKVHSSILARHSEIFSDMAEIPQPHDCELIDGCPVVDLQDDVEEFTDTLRAIYDPMHFDTLDSKSTLSTLLTFLSGILRITTKYAMEKLRRKCISFLEAKFPSTLDGCLSLLASQFQYSSADIVRLIALASAHNGGANIPSVLPWAYYLCTQMTVDEIIGNDVLTWECKAVCLAGKEKLWHAFTTISHSMLFSFSPSPLCQSACAGKLAQLALPSQYGGADFGGGRSGKLGSISWKEAEDLRMRPHPLEEYGGWGPWKSAVCTRCFGHLKDMHMAGRQKVWQELPVYFGLGTWDGIRRDEES
ncbi:hypothetical protein D9611_005476 [Ephemerocybe angulata]|uniref:BTB domain-containing protein n=1 Tax=Ephemerocybe angulata TaxID=980116 RepID=A0A8H5C021_9AGAR|nr:hypothetical protein D9611_005476 [Tulosesus angulatus]